MYQSHDRGLSGNVFHQSQLPKIISFLIRVYYLLVIVFVFLRSRKLSLHDDEKLISGISLPNHVVVGSNIQILEHIGHLVPFVGVSFF